MLGDLEREIGQLHEAARGEHVESRVRRVERDLARPVVGVRPEDARSRGGGSSRQVVARSLRRRWSRSGAQTVGPLVPFCRTRAASSANSQSSGRVSRGSMISSTRNASAVLNGDWRAASRCSISARSASGIVGRFELRLVRGLDAAFERKAAPVARRPREPVRELRRVLVRGARDAVHLAHDHRAPRRRRLVDRGERTRAVADRRGLLGVGADHEAGIVDEVHDREMERLGEIDEARRPSPTRPRSSRPRRSTDRSRAPRPAGRRAARAR